MNCDISTVKILTGKVVLSAVIARIEWIFETFSSICLSFSGGKDSTVLSILWQMWPAGKNVDSQYYSLTGKLSTSAQLHTF